MRADRGLSGRAYELLVVILMVVGIGLVGGCRPGKPQKAEQAPKPEAPSPGARQPIVPPPPVAPVVPPPKATFPSKAGTGEPIKEPSQAGSPGATETGPSKSSQQPHAYQQNEGPHAKDEVALAEAELEKNLQMVDLGNQEEVKRLVERFGPPLVDHPDQLVRLHPIYPLWIDKPPRNVIFIGVVCQRRVPLELFACLKGSKEHEAILVVCGEAFLIHSALLATKAEPGSPVQFQPDYVPPRGTEIEITLVWKDLSGRIQRARAQHWVRNSATGKEMDNPWVFAGSQFRVDEFTRERQYRADADGSLISLANFPSAMLDVPMRSSDANSELAFEAFTEHIPPRGTPVTVILTPRLDKQAKPDRPKPTGKK